MATDGNDRKATKPGHVGAPPPEPEHLPCPRCDSTNTKFCYYNNYNFSQPRHFCKSCRRYWTHGGTLRDIPVGGGSRKNAKRSRTSVNSAVNVTNGGGGGGGGVSVFSMPHHHHHHHHEFRHFPAGLVPFGDNGVNGPFVGEGGKMCGSFTSLLNTQGSGGLLGLGGFGPGIEELGFGLGRAVWPFGGVVEGGVSGGSGGGASVGGHTWQLENVEGGFV